MNAIRCVVLHARLLPTLNVGTLNPGIPELETLRLTRQLSTLPSAGRLLSISTYGIASCHTPLCCTLVLNKIAKDPGSSHPQTLAHTATPGPSAKSTWNFDING